MHVGEASGHASTGISSSRNRTRNAHGSAAAGERHDELGEVLLVLRRLGDPPQPHRLAEFERERRQLGGVRRVRPGRDLDVGDTQPVALGAQVADLEERAGRLGERAVAVLPFGADVVDLGGAS